MKTKRFKIVCFILLSLFYCHYSKGQNNLQCLEVLGSISQLSAFKAQNIIPKYIFEIRKCLKDEFAEIEFYKYKNSTYYQYNGYLRGFQSVNCVPGEIINIVTNNFLCRKPCSVQRFEKKLCKVLTIKSETIYALVYYSKIKN